MPETTTASDQTLVLNRQRASLRPPGGNDLTQRIEHIAPITRTTLRDIAILSYYITRTNPNHATSRMHEILQERTQIESLRKKALRQLLQVKNEKNLVMAELLALKVPPVDQIRATINEQTLK